MLFWILFFMGVHAVIVAAGMGKRFGGMKQFYQINRRPLLLYTLDIFEKCRRVSDIVLVVPEKRVRVMQKLVRLHKMKKVSRIIAGGRRRQDSVLTGLCAIRSADGIVIIHDGVRPLVSQSLLNRGIDLCNRHKAVVFGLPLADTVKHVLANRVLGTIPRKTLFTVQTPQFFDIRYLRSAYKKADLRNEFTDEASILESTGKRVFLFDGENTNIKITTKQDLIFLKMLLK
jgi:2-C-methyl-D-erythritol 4-phosphate cytidylyltransferase